MSFVSISTFCKPKQSIDPTRYLYVCGLGHQIGSDKQLIRQLFEKYGQLDYKSYQNYDDNDDDDDDGDNNHDNIDNAIEFVENKRYCYVSYLSIDSAIAAINNFKNDYADTSPGLSNIQLKFASKLNEVKARSSTIEPIDVLTTQHIVIPGLKIIEDFLSLDEETRLLESEIGDRNSNRWEELISRRIQHYGLIFNYRTLMLDYSTTIPPIPSLVSDLLPRISTHVSTNYPFEQLTINEYLPGQGIASHIDTNSCLGPDIVIISLGSGVVMTFQERRPKESPSLYQSDLTIHPTTIARTIIPNNKLNDSTNYPLLKVSADGQIISQEVEKIDSKIDSKVDSKAGSCTNKKYSRRKFVYLPPRSLLILQDEARYNWSHGITPRKFDKINSSIVPRDRRISLTLRQIFIPGEIPTHRLVTNELENDFVYKVYDSIAIHWNHTRGRRKVHWHRVKDFIDNLPRGSIVADIGSGDGKYFSVNPDITVIGCDRSLKLLEVSKEASHETFCCDAVKLPFISNKFDATICIAVMHHLSTLDRRIALIRELLRITRLDGEVMIQAWALEQDNDSRWDFNQQRESGGVEGSKQDVLVPWKLQKRFFLPDDSNKIVNNQIDKQIADLVSNNIDSQIDSKVDESIDCNHVSRTEDGSLMFQRYCHVYKQGELEDLCSSCPGNRIVESGWDKGNWFIRLLKVNDINTTIGPSTTMPRSATRL